MGDFFGASLISDQVARRRKNSRLKTEGVIAAHDNFQTHDSDLLDDHVGELLFSDVFFDHGEIPGAELTLAIQPKIPELFVNEHG
jgi:hypothetical protein